VKLLDSGTTPKATPAYQTRIEVDVTGKKELRLVVTDAGDGINADCADFADARLLPKTLTTNSTPTATAPTSTQKPVAITPPTPVVTDPNANFTFMMAAQSYKTAAYKQSETAFSYLPNTRNINFDWGYGTPFAGTQPDWFLVGWSGTFIAPASGNYTFYSEQDDALALQLGSTQAAFTIDAWTSPWNGRPQQSAQGTANLNQGQKVPIYVYFTEMTGVARARLYWSGPGITGRPLFPNLK
jgi:hypothetical protein